jgi:hypothetical protein
MNKEEYEEYHRIFKILSFWNRFLENKNTEFWSKEDFEIIIDNEQIIYEYRIGYYDGKSELIKRDNDSKPTTFIKTITRLREIYDERFNKNLNQLAENNLIQENEIEDHTKFSYYERMELLRRIGIEDSDIYKNLSNTGQHQLISKILDIHKDNARKVKDGTYPAGNLDKVKIDTFLTRFRKK